MTYDITSTANERIKWLIRLAERRHRDAEGVFVVEGERLYGRALGAGLTPRITFVDRLGVATTGETLTVDPSTLSRASYRKKSDGVVGVFDQMDLRLEQLPVFEPSLVLMLEGTEKPGNLGAILRTASVGGVDAVVAVESSVDPHNPNVVRASTGALFTVPLAVADWDEARAWAAAHGLALLGASGDGDDSLWDIDFTRPCAVIVGAEDRGLSVRARAVAHRLVSIPQVGESVDSLNASVAAALFVYESARQRGVR